MKLAIVAMQQLDAAGHKVSPADGVPGLWNVDGLARDVTTNQLFDLAERHGVISMPSYLPGITIQGMT